MASELIVGSPGWVRAYGNQLRVIIGSTELFAYSSDAPSNCATVSSDTLKLYGSLAQGSLLSGKVIGVSYESCGGQNMIISVELSK